MNPAQDVWWKQAKSDYGVYVRLRTAAGVEQCHVLHYLQMASEKLAKAYLWRSNTPPPKSHTGFKKFLRALLDRPPRELERIAKAFRFERAADFDRWVSQVLELARDLENMAPTEANDGPSTPGPTRHPPTTPRGTSSNSGRGWNPPDRGGSF